MWQQKRAESVSHEDGGQKNTFTLSGGGGGVKKMPWAKLKNYHTPPIYVSYVT